MKRQVVSGVIGEELGGSQIARHLMGAHMILDVLPVALRRASTKEPDALTLARFFEGCREFTAPVDLNRPNENRHPALQGDEKFVAVALVVRR